MPVDVAAEVIANRRCRPTTTCWRSRAPAIAAAAAPGQFVMVKAGARPRSAAAPAVFGVRGPARRRTARRPASRSSTSASASRPVLIYDARAGPAHRLPRPARPAVLARRSADRSVDGGRRRRTRAVCDARRSAARARRARRRCSTAPARGAELFYLDFFRALGVELVLTTEDGSAGERGRIVAPLERALAVAAAPIAPVMIYACGPEGMLAATARDRDAATAGRARCRSSASWDAASAAATAASCRCAATTARFHHVRSCIAGPVLPGIRYCGTRGIITKVTKSQRIDLQLLCDLRACRDCACDSWISPFRSAR